MESSSGVTVTDVDGNTFYDLTGSYGVDAGESSRALWRNRSHCSVSVHRSAALLEAAGGGDGRCGSGARWKSRRSYVLSSSTGNRSVALEVSHTRAASPFVVRTQRRLQ
jgi:hypothetical protein